MTPWVLRIIIANVIVFVISIASPGVLYTFGLVPALALFGAAAAGGAGGRFQPGSGRPAAAVARAGGRSVPDQRRPRDPAERFACTGGKRPPGVPGGRDCQRGDTMVA